VVAVGVGVGVVVGVVVGVAVAVGVAVGVAVAVVVGVDVTGAKCMMKIVETTDASGLLALMGQRVTLFCANYIYAGKLSGVNERFVLLTDKPCIVYETGPLGDGQWKDAQLLPQDELYVMQHAIESFMVLK